MRRYVLSDETVLPDWGVDVKVDPITGQLLSVPLNADKTIYGDCNMQPIELTCAHFLYDANEALGTNFQPDDFPMISCEGHPIEDSEGKVFWPDWPK